MLLLKARIEKLREIAKVKGFALSERHIMFCVATQSKSIEECENDAAFKADPSLLQLKAIFDSIRESDVQTELEHVQERVIPPRPRPPRGHGSYQHFVEFFACKAPRRWFSYDQAVDYARAHGMDRSPRGKLYRYCKRAYNDDRFDAVHLGRLGKRFCFNEDMSAVSKTQPTAENTCSP